jgi:hypothetical protein
MRACVLRLKDRTFCHASDIFGVIMARVNVVNLNLVQTRYRVLQ